MLEIDIKTKLNEKICRQISEFVGRFFTFLLCTLSSQADCHFVLQRGFRSLKRNHLARDFGEGRSEFPSKNFPIHSLPVASSNFFFRQFTCEQRGLQRGLALLLFYYYRQSDQTLRNRATFRQKMRLFTQA